MPRHAWAKIVKDPPVNAWLLVGDEASWPDDEELAHERAHWRPGYEGLWTAPKQVQPGDLLFFYFLSPMKQIRFAARASTYPFFDKSIKVNALRRVNENQWWVGYTPMVPLRPVGYARLQELMDGHLILRGRPVHYLPPSIATQILRQGAEHRELTALDRAVLQQPTGDPQLPTPGRMSLAQWRSLSEGPLTLERQVEEHLVEPLLRLALSQARAVSWKRAVRLPGGGVPDYVVYRGGNPVCAVEVKVGVREAREGERWADSPDFRQVQRYAVELGVRSALVDSNRIFLFRARGRKPSAVLRRKEFTDADLQVVREHFCGG